MNKTITLVSAFALSTILTACGGEKYSGTINVAETLSFSQKKKTITLPVGQYAASVKASSKTNLALEIKLDKKNKLEIDFKAAKGTKIIADNGTINLPASMNKQPYDIVGRQTIYVDDGSKTRTTESCTYTENEYSCWTEEIPETCDKEGNCSGGGTQNDCGYIDLQKSGTQEVEYFYRSTDKYVAVNLNVPNTNTVVATFKGSVSYSNKVYTYEGACY